MTAPTDFEKRLIELNLTYAQIKLIKQAVNELVIGSDEIVDPFLDQDWFLISTSQLMGGVKPYHLKRHRNDFRVQQRAVVGK